MSEEKRQLTDNEFLCTLQEKLETIKFEMKDAVWSIKERRKSGLSDAEELDRMEMVLVFANSVVSVLSDKISEMMK